MGDNLQDHVIGDGIEFYTPYSGVSVTAARAENFGPSWSYSLFGTGEHRPSHLQMLSGPKMTGAALSRQAVDGRRVSKLK